MVITKLDQMKKLLHETHLDNEKEWSTKLMKKERNKEMGILL